MKLSSRERRERRKWRRYRRTRRHQIAAEWFAEALATGFVGVAPMKIPVFWIGATRPTR